MKVNFVNSKSQFSNINQMKGLYKLYNKNKTFFILYLIWLILLSSIILFIPKNESFLFINSLNNTFFDYFFSIITQFGDGIFVIALAITCFFIKQRRLCYALASTYIGSGLICSFLKKAFHAPRPASNLFDDPNFHAVSWLPLSHHNAFPSGHTTSAFAMAITIALFSKNKSLGILAIIIAFLTGYSRVYLGQHYWEDVWFGSILGVGFSCIFYSIFSFYSQNKFSFKILPPPNFKI